MKILKKVLLSFGFLFLFILLISLAKTIFNTPYDLKSVEVPQIGIQEDAVDRLSESIRFETLGQEEGKYFVVFGEFINFLKKCFPEVFEKLKVKIFNEYTLLIELTGKDQTLSPGMLMGHYDVVPIENRNQWKQPPFSGKVVDGEVWGRGAIDNKSTIMAFFEVLSMLIKNNIRPERTLYFAINHDEEIGGIYGAKAIASYFKQKGIILEYTLDEGSLVVKSGYPGIKDKSVALIGIAEKGFMTLELTVKMKETGHSSMPPLESSISILARSIDRLRQNPFPLKFHFAVKEMFSATSPHMDFGFKFLFSNLWWSGAIIKNVFNQKAQTRAMVHTTMVPTVIKGGIKENVLPAKASVLVNFRIIPGETSDQVINRVRSVINDEQVQISKYKPEDIHESSPFSDIESQFYSMLKTEVHHHFKHTVVAPSLVVTATDSRHVKQIAKDSYRFMPIELGIDQTKQIHGMNERISVKTYKKMISFYYNLIQKL